MFGGRFSNTVYVKVYPNRIELKHIESGNGAVEVAREPFTTRRLLVGNFTSAIATMADGMRKMRKAKWFEPKPIVIIQPMEKVELGLSEVEDRTFRDLAASSGARKVSVWVGHELSDSEVIAKAKRE